MFCGPGPLRLQIARPFDRTNRTNRTSRKLRECHLLRDEVATISAELLSGIQPFQFDPMARIETRAEKTTQK
jgi:hypothetical protein